MLAQRTNIKARREYLERLSGATEIFQSTHMDDQTPPAQHQQSIDRNFHVVSLERHTTKTKRTIGMIIHYLVICDVDPVQASRLFGPILCCLVDDTDQDDDPFEAFAERKRLRAEREKRENERLGDLW